MAVDVPAVLKKLLEIVPGKQTGLAKRLGKQVTQSQVSRWLTGTDTPSTRNYELIVELATELGVLGDLRSEDVADMLENQRPKPRMVKVKGYVGAGEQQHYYAVNDGDLEEIEAEGATETTVAAVIIGKSLGKFFERWYVLYDDVRRPITTDLIGQLCVVGLEDGKVLIKKIRRNGKGFDLESNSDNEPLIANARIEWAAKVNDIKPRR